MVNVHNMEYIIFPIISTLLKTVVLLETYLYVI